ncbi:hypothetical protein HMPREF1221_00402 [Treponema socranskii subsp. paredis ATCC 35535]|jgi:hypothetical protein|nr:hypothetical protein HMPREF1221_00402 [Treponema socranskii subsp. paredis ATCC 35535]
MDEKSSLIYEGDCFRIEWFYDQNGFSQAYEYFLKTSDVQKRKLLILIKKMGDFGKIFDKTKFNYEGDQIYVFKPQPDRYLCFFFKGKRIIITNAFYKKTQKLPLSEKKRSMEILKKYDEMHIKISTDDGK